MQTIQPFQPSQPLDEHLNPVAAKMFLAALPDRIQSALLAYANEAEYPLELVIEMAIASFLDSESLTFEDCHPELK